jgi:Tol biopolymer transport system component
VYASYASNLVADDLNERPDIFLNDRMAYSTILISRGLDGASADGLSGNPVISLSGDWIAFTSDAENLVPIEKNWDTAIYLYNRIDGTISLGSINSNGTPANGLSTSPSLSVDGRYLVFVSSATNLAERTGRERLEVYIHDRQSGQTDIVSRAADGGMANDYSNWPVVSMDGRYVAFWSWASNLVPGESEFCQVAENPGPCADIYIFDREKGVAERIEVGQSSGLGIGGVELSLSKDGRYLAYYSVVYDRQSQTGETICEPVEFDWCGYSPSISSIGRWIAYGTADDSRQVWVYDRQSGVNTQISLSPEGQPANGDAGLVFFHEGFFGSLVLSMDGRLVVYASQATNLTTEDLGLCEDMLTFSGQRPCYGVFLHDRQTGLTELISYPNPAQAD